MKQKIVIVGGVAGGATAAARLRRLSEENEIIMFERDEYISFANCGLPYYIGDVIQDRSKLLVQTVEGMSKRFNLDIRNFSEVTSIDKENNKVTVNNAKTGKTYEESYDKLILSPGAKAIVPPMTGLDQAENVFSLRNIPDTDKIRGYVDEKKPKSAVVIGGGFIGVEMAENLAHRGVEVTLVDLADQIMAPFDYEMAAVLQDEMTNHGVKLILGDAVKEFQNKGHHLILNSGQELDTDMVILAIGVRPENTLAQDAGLKVGPRGHIVTTKQLLTVNDQNDQVEQDIYAIGDAIEVYDWVDDSKTAIALAWPANRQGRLVADHINGKDIEYKGTLGSSVAKIFNLTAASTGNNEKTLKRKEVNYKAIHVHRGNHAGYYPGASNITIKLVFDPETGKIFGAQAVGGEGTEKRIDVIATAIKGGLTVQDLPDLELCYAPPYSSAKDPSNIAGYVASNIMDGVYDVVHWNEIDNIVANGGYLLDVRTPMEFDLGHIKGANNIPVDDLRNRLSEIKIDKDQPIYVNCQVGLRAYLAIRILQENGYQNVFNLSGGYKTYLSAMKPNLSEDTLPHTPESEDIDTQGVESGDTKKSVPDKITETIKIDACGLQCPGPIMQTYKAVDAANDGDIILVQSTDSGFARDVDKWCDKTGNTLLKVEQNKNVYSAYIQKGCDACPTVHNQTSNENTTIVLFSGDMDKAMASMIIAQGSAAMGKNVTVFCTFWGLNLLRKQKHPKVKKNFIEKMFGRMMPKGPGKMGISKMNFGGMGAKMMKRVMKKKNVDSLEDLLNSAQEHGVKLIACTMSMDVMGITKDELIDGIDYAGVATYLAESDQAGVTLFI
ncbi:CoA-disulfide reductase [Haloplasma contractile]|uniref:NADH dehydrogenase protein n=1 Tax=Haloplasma contractile SSD-17B TaxID=1033810 RepID=F7PVK5_9MOLU|nr:CoA-disulfide reductase [Haloplasma contractile]ERJ12828.1 NADH dehydrogenase protein [Haloplasma contractile SSD-17B]